MYGVFWILVCRGFAIFSLGKQSALVQDLRTGKYEKWQVRPNSEELGTRGPVIDYKSTLCSRKYEIWYSTRGFLSSVFLLVTHFILFFSSSLTAMLSVLERRMNKLIVWVQLQDEDSEPEFRTINSTGQEISQKFQWRYLQRHLNGWSHCLRIVAVTGLTRSECHSRWKKRNYTP